MTFYFERIKINPRQVNIEKNMKKVFCFIAVVILIPFLSGCVTYVRPGPPPLRTEIVGAVPYPDAVWVAGHWAWKPRYGGYVWIPGHWRGVY